MIPACDGSQSQIRILFRLTGVGAVLVILTVERGVIVRQRHAEEISAAANFARAAGTARASRSWTGAWRGASSERFKNVGRRIVTVLVTLVTITNWVLRQY
jgi:hypothetical protein